MRVASVAIVVAVRCPRRRGTPWHCCSSRYVASSWYSAALLFVVVCLRGSFFCLRLYLQKLLLLLLPLSRWEARNKKGPAWLFDRFKVNNFGNP
jgi:hypothetical protein